MTSIRSLNESEIAAQMTASIEDDLASDPVSPVNQPKLTPPGQKPQGRQNDGDFIPQLLKGATIRDNNVAPIRKTVEDLPKATQPIVTATAPVTVAAPATPAKHETENYMARATIREADMIKTNQAALDEEQRALEALKDAHSTTIESINRLADGKLAEEQAQIDGLKAKIAHHEERMSRLRQQRDDALAMEEAKFNEDASAHTRMITGFEVLIDTLSQRNEALLKAIDKKKGSLTGTKQINNGEKAGQVATDGDDATTA